ncbi:MAG TPA: hypothetical protein VK388_09130 [Pyrinomonadaceae bacterium]|nr:hypothetical protein [Pyrinomonadaceae bacterium]
MSKKRKKQRLNRKKVAYIGKVPPPKKRLRLLPNLSFSNGIAITSLLVATLALVIYLFFEWPRPRIVITNINPVTSNPLKHQFTVINEGNFTASSLRVVLNVDLNAPSSSLIVNDVGFSDFSPIEGIDVAPKQSISFDLEGATPLNSLINLNNTEVSPSDAAANISFEYKGLLGYRYEDKISFRTFPENSNLIWKPVGPTYSQVYR